MSVYPKPTKDGHVKPIIKRSLGLNKYLLIDILNNPVTRLTQRRLMIKITQKTDII